MRRREFSSVSRQAGFSVVELLTVVAVIAVLGGVSLFYLVGHKTAYKPDDESLMITDILQEARQRSLTQRRTMRVEINLTNNTARLVDENQNSTTADDDFVIKAITLFPQGEVKVGSLPANISYVPPEPLLAPVSVFKPSVYPTSISQTVCTLRFKSDGTVVDAGNSPVGTGASMTGATIPIWSPLGSTSNSDIARAITVIGSTGTIRLWEFDPSLTGTNKWKDSRRYGTYGGAATPTPSPTP